MLFALRSASARVGRWPRLAAAGICLLLAASSAVNASSAAKPAAGVPVVVAARDLPAGHRLAAGDLAVARWPRGLPPVGARGDPAGLVGARLAGPLLRREAVTSARLLGPGVVAGLPVGTVATVVVVDQDDDSFVRPGDRVDLLAAPRSDLASDGSGDAAGSVTEVARRLLVLSAVASGSGSDVPTTMLVLAVDRTTARRIAELRAFRAFSVVGEPP